MSISDRPRVGFIGLGSMGTPMCRRLLAAGFPVTARDVVSARMDEMAAAGADTAGSVAEVAANSEIVIMMLPDSPQVETAVTAHDGLMSGLREGTLVIDMSTIAPSTTRRVAGLVTNSGSRFIDAPVGRTSRHAEEGDLLIMVGGEAGDIDRAIPVLERFGKEIVRCGPVGSGETMKLTNNLLTATIVAANAEALVLGVASGLDLQVVLRVLRMTAASNTHLRTTYAEKALKRDFSPGFATQLAVKDLRLAMSLAIDNQLPVGVGAAALQLFSIACDQGHEADDYTSVMTVLEGLAGVELREAATA